MVAAYKRPGAAIDATFLQQAEALYRLYRHLLRERSRQSPGSKGNAIIHSALRPLARLVRAWGPTRTYGPAVARVAGMPLWLQFVQQWLLAMRFDFSSDTYYRYRLYQLDHIGEAILFFPSNVYMALRKHLYEHMNVDVAQFDDKRVFYRSCAKHGLPVPVTVAEVVGGVARAWGDGGDRVVLPRCDLFSKPADALGGKGAARWIWQGRGCYCGENGEMLTGDELLERLAALSRSAPYILQERLTNHPAIATLGPNALCTARVVTCRDINGSPQHLISIFRMPRASASASTDNFSGGGFASPIDHASGTLGNAVRMDLHDAAVDCLEYPDSKRPFTSFCLPHWDAALELCLRAHRVFPEFPSVGWDVAITPDGPILVEGNHDWGGQLAQQPGCRPLGRTPFVKSYRSFLEETTPFAKSADRRNRSSAL